jgi:signal transduction histidine kinase
MVYQNQMKEAEEKYLTENEYTEKAFLNNFYHYSSQILNRIAEDKVIMKEIIRAESIQTTEILPLEQKLIEQMKAYYPDDQSIEDLLISMNPDHRFINSYLSSLELVDLSNKVQNLAKYKTLIKEYHDAQAHLLLVRNGLYDLLKDYYNIVDIYACDEIHLVLSDGTNLLRMNHYNPERIKESYFGDNLLAERNTLKDIHREEIIKTFEVGPYHSQYRCIVPIFSDNKRIASIETGLGLKKIEQLVETTNPEIEILSIFPDMEEYSFEADTPSTIIPCTFREGHSFYNFYQNREGIVPLLNKRLTDIFYSNVRLEYLDYKRFSLQMRIDNKDIVLLFNPVINYDNSPVGYILTVRDFPVKQGLLLARNKAILISILVLFIVLMIVYFVQCRRSEKTRFSQALGTITEKLLEGIIVIKRDGKVKFVNRAGTIFLGTDKKSILDMKVTDVIARIQFKEETSWERIVEEIMENGFYTNDDTMIKADRASIAVSLLAIYINPTENVTNDFLDSIVLVLNDITHHKIYENCLIAAKEEAETSDKLKSTFLNNFSHEIRTPLNSIVGFSYLLTHDNPTPDLLARYVEVINKNSEYLLSVVQNIIEISQLERDEYRIYPDVFSLNSMMTELFNEYEEYIQESRKPIKLFCKTGLNDGSDQFMNDGKRLKQVMDFLLDNAVKFTELGHIEFGYRIYEKDTLLFWVHDTGIGIEEEEQSRIFKPFYQIKDGNHIKFSGTGLGLSIASKIVHLMGGNIWVKSEYTQGTTMYFALNLVTQESLEDELASLGIEDE